MGGHQLLPVQFMCARALKKHSVVSWVQPSEEWQGKQEPLAQWCVIEKSTFDQLTTMERREEIGRLNKARLLEVCDEIHYVRD
jgi:hypothetical protein